MDVICLRKLHDVLFENVEESTDLRTHVAVKIDLLFLRGFDSGS